MHRKITNHWIWNNDSYFKWWSYMLFRANHETTKVLIGSSIESCEPGEFITSLNHLSRDLKTSIQKIRTFILLLENDSMIVKKTTNKLTKITICNYSSYQTEQQTNNKQITNKQQTSNKQITTDKNVKNVKNVKNKKNNKKKFGDFVLLTDEEYQKLISKFGEPGTMSYIERLDNYIGSKGTKYKSHYHTILTWSNKDESSKKLKQPKTAAQLKKEQADQAAEEFLRDEYSTNNEINLLEV